MRKTFFSVLMTVFATATMAQVPAGVPTSNLTAYYNFNSNSDDQWLDRDLTWTGTPGYTEDRWGNTNGAVAFDLNNFLQDSDFPFPNGDFTVSLWFWSEVSNNGQFCTLMEIDESIFMRFLASSNLNGTAGFYRPDNGDFALLGIPGFSNPPGSWIHLALVNDASTSNVWLYVNGQQYGQAQQYLGGAASASPGMGLTVGPGTSVGAENEAKRWNGYIDDLFIYNRGLSAQEVEDVFSHANDGGNPPLNCSVGNLLITEGQTLCRSNIVEFIEAGTASVPPGGDIQWQATFNTGGGSFTESGAFSQEPYELPLSVGGQFNASYTFNVRDANSAVCATETVNVVILDSEDPACDGQSICDVGNVLVSSGAQICLGESVDYIQEGTTVFPPGVNFISYRFTPPGNPQGFSGTTSNPWTYTIDPSRAPGIYNVEMVVRFEGNVGICDEVNIEVEVLDQNDPACGNPPAPCTAGTFAIGNGQVICPQVSVQAVVFGSGDPGPGGTLTYTLVPLEGQLALSEATFTNTFELNALMAGPGGVSGQYDLVVRAYAAGATTPCDEMSITVDFVTEQDPACFCEIGTLMINNGTVICPGETVTILTGNVQIPADRELGFEIYDYPDFNIYYEEQSPFNAPYTFTHNGTYFGDAVFYVYTYGTGPAAPPVDLHTRGGGGGDICSFYEVFVTLAESTDAACLGVGVDEMNLTEETIYPNPTSGELYFSSPTSGLVLDVTGKELMTFSQRIAIDLSRFSTGMYMVKTEGGTVHRVFRK